MKIEIEGLREAVRKFERMPAEAKDGLRIALRISLREIAEYARDNHRFVTRSGDTEREMLKTSFDDTKGVVELINRIAIYQHEGTGIYGPRKRVIVVEPKRKMALRWTPDGTGFIFSKGHEIKGIKPDPFLYKAAEHERPEIISRFEAAIKKIAEG